MQIQKLGPNPTHNKQQAYGLARKPFIQYTNLWSFWHYYKATKLSSNHVLYSAKNRIELASSLILDPTQPNPLKSEKYRPNPIQPNPTQGQLWSMWRYCYLCQGGYVLPGVCLSVCLLATSHKNYCSDLYENFTRDVHVLFCSVLFFSRPRSEGWPHHRRTFSIDLCPLTF